MWSSKLYTKQCKFSELHVPISTQNNMGNIMMNTELLTLKENPSKQTAPHFNRAGRGEWTELFCRYGNMVRAEEEMLKFH